MEDVTRDEQVIQAANNDPLMVHTTTARWGAKVLDTIEWVNAHPGDVRLPVMLAHGEADIVNSVEGPRRFFSQMTFPDKELKTYPGGMHELHNDLVKDQFLTGRLRLFGAAMKCSQCAFENGDGARFCENCGSPLKLSCTRCGAELSAGTRFCRNCGAPTPAASGQAGEKERLSALQQSAPGALQEKIRLASRQVEGQRKPVTILFTDIVGSTALAEKLDPEEWKEIVNGAHERVSQAVYRYEGTIAQLLGDGVLAFFGAPVTHEDDPERAVRAGLEIQKLMEDYAHDLRRCVDNFKMRIGLNTGTVVVGSVGSDMHLEYLAVGDAVNLAARLQSAAQPGKVLISAATARLVKADFELCDLGETTVKGKVEPVRIFEVAGPRVVPLSRRGIEGLSSPLVGRTHELGLLQGALAALQEGYGQIVVLLGEAGIGKSRLVEEARCKCQRQSGSDQISAPPIGTSEFTWLEGRALSYGQTLPFWIITQLIQNDLGLSDGDSEPRMRVALRRRVQALFGDQSVQALPYLAHLLGLKLEGEQAETVSSLDGETLKRQTLLAVRDYFTRLAQERPTVLVCEDFHWADPSSLEAIEGLLEQTDRFPLMILLLSRIERGHGSWRIKLKAETDYPHRFTEIELAPLALAESQELVNNLLEIAELPEGIRALILERSEGNPFYLEEIIRSLIEQGAIVHEGSAWRGTAALATVTIPETLQGVLLARIDRLEEDVRRTLQLASVIGKTFLYRLLEAISAAELELDQHLAQLQRADLVREKTRRPELEYIFKHSLTQEAAYSSLLIERRREFHRKVGEALEALFAERQEDFLGLLAYHFDAAGDTCKAIDYLLKAGDRTRMEDAHEEALRFYQRAVDLLTESGDEVRAARTWLKLGLVYQANFDFESAHQAFETAFSLQQKQKVSNASMYTPNIAPNTLRIVDKVPQYIIDPGRCSMAWSNWILWHMFSGLTSIDKDMNVIPEAARSWEVLEDGTRYLFHLRDDLRWTDGSPLTAVDFEWAWKRNLHPATQAVYAYLLDDICGARDYRLGYNLDPASVGIKALDLLTFEVCLNRPSAGFLYLTSVSITCPLPPGDPDGYGNDGLMLLSLYRTAHSGGF